MQLIEINLANNLNQLLIEIYWITKLLKKLIDIDWTLKMAKRNVFLLIDYQSWEIIIGIIDWYWLKINIVTILNFKLIETKLTTYLLLYLLIDIAMNMLILYSTEGIKKK